MDIKRIDHLVMTVASIEKTLAFYTTILGMKHITFAKGRHALHFGQSKINLHEINSPIEPKALHPLPGSLDICLIASTSLEVIEAHLKKHGVTIVEGPVQKTGAEGPIFSLYIRDPDLNLIEISNYL